MSTSPGPLPWLPPGSGHCDVDSQGSGHCPDLTAPRHTLRLEGDFGRAVIQVEPWAGENQRSSTLAAYSVLALLERLNDTIVFG